MKHRSLSILFILLTALCGILLLTSCGRKHFDKIPRTAFISHYEYNDQEIKPFLSIWVDPKRVDKAESSIVRNKSLRLYIKPVTLKYLAATEHTERHKVKIEELREYFDDMLLTQFQKRQSEMPMLKLATRPGPSTYTLEIAITSVRPTPVRTHVLSQGLGFVRAGAGILVEQLDPKGSISMEAKFTNPSGRVVAELADYHEDRSAIIGIDIKDFEKFAHHRRNIKNWSRELAESFTSPADTRVKGAPPIVLLPF